MPKTKASKKVAKKEPTLAKVQAKRGRPIAPPEQSFEVASAPSVVGFPKFEGVAVIAVVRESVNGRWHRCAMADGTTKDVPVELFPGSQSHE